MILTAGFSEMELDFADIWWAQSGAEDGGKEGWGDQPDRTVKTVAVASCSGLEPWAPVTMMAMAKQ